MGPQGIQGGRKVVGSGGAGGIKESTCLARSWRIGRRGPEGGLPVRDLGIKVQWLGGSR